MIDLHVHSNFSDGADSPDELVARARRIGVRALALTDHDNAAGIPAFIAACRARKLTGFTGIELSVDVPSGTLHLVGLAVDQECPALNEVLARVLDGRDWRNHRILEKLQALGLTLTWDEVARCAGADVVGRPHFAQAMIARGWVETVQAAFDRFLAKGAPAYVGRYRAPPDEAIRVIRLAGGLPILAHPLTWCADLPRLEAGIEDLKAHGLAGIEAYCPTHSTEMTIDLLRLARRQGLLVSGGTDYHGLSVKPEIELGKGGGQFEVPDSLLEPLFAAVGANGQYHREA